MKFKIKENILENIAIFSISGLIIVSVFLLITNAASLLGFFSKVLSIAMPFILGMCIAFLIYPLQVKVEKEWLKNSTMKLSTKRNISVFAAMTVFLLIIGSFFAVLIPQLYSSMNTLITTLSKLLESDITINESLLFKNEYFVQVLNTLIESSEGILKSALANVSALIPSLINYSYSFMTSIINFFIGLIIAIYILLDRERFKRQLLKVSYAFMSEKTVASIASVFKLSGRMFNQFIFGKALDSLIIGIICFIFMSVVKMPYTLLISFIIGLTNMIPVFGPFIGAIPSIFILLIINPLTAVWFAIFILILQQVDGNIIGPYILGDSMGLSSLWIMFAIIVGGGFFGVFGMFVGVPVFSVIYIIAKQFIEKILEKKNIKVE